MGQKDITEKLLEDYEDVFADIVNVLLYNGEPVVDKDNLRSCNVKSQYKADDGKLHEQERDIAKLEVKNGITFALYGLENQEKADKYMPLRIYGYEGASYRSQYGKNPYPIVTLVLYYGETRWGYASNLKSLLHIPEGLEKYVNDIKLNIFEIAFLTDEQLEMFQSDFKIIADYFVQKRKNEKYKPSTKEIKHVDAFLKMMSVFTQDNRYAEAIEAMKLKGGVVTMCTVLDERETKGRAEGRAEEQHRLIIVNYKEGESVTNIAKFMRITEDEVKKVLGLD